MSKYNVKYEVINDEQHALITVEIKVEALDVASALVQAKGMLSDKYKYKLLKVERL